MTSLTYDNFCIRLRTDVPGFDRVYDEHVADYDDVLPHVLFGDLVRFLENDVALHGAEGEALKQAMLLLEHGMDSPDPRLQELVSVSFLENLEPGDPSSPAIRRLFGPRLAEEYKHYDPDAARPGLDAAIERLTGIVCWGTIAGSVVALDFGARRLRDRPLQNPHITPEQREYSGEVCLTLLCAWRLDSPAGIVCGSRDDDGLDGLMLRGLGQLTGARVQHVAAADVTGDLTIAFDRGLTLHVFVNSAAPGWGNYIIHLDDACLGR